MNKRATTVTHIPWRSNGLRGAYGDKLSACKSRWHALKPALKRAFRRLERITAVASVIIAAVSLIIR